jgi:polyhydroxyalkanoic acid synthase PhaR subunit
VSEPNEIKTFDPFEVWRGMRDASMDAWAKAMVQAVNTETYAKSSGAMLNAYLTASIPFREMLEKTMMQALERVNMPTRADFISLAERLIQIETRLDDLDVKLEQLAQQRVAEEPTVKASRKESK